MSNIETYIKFVSNVLLGANPNATDEFYKENELAILDIVKLMQEKHPVKVDTIYRGILLEPNEGENLILNPFPHIKYLSFSEDKEVAEDFADTQSEMSKFYMAQNPNSKGFLIEHKPNLDEILFHYSWASVLGLDMVFGKESMNVIEKQKEVTLRQRLLKFKLEPM